MPVSAQEWVASATIDAEPVMAAAAVFATAIARFAPNARATVRVLSRSGVRCLRNVVRVRL